MKLLQKLLLKLKHDKKLSGPLKLVNEEKIYYIENPEKSKDLYEKLIHKEKERTKLAKKEYKRLKGQVLELERMNDMNEAWINYLEKMIGDLSQQIVSSQNLNHTIV